MVTGLMSNKPLKIRPKGLGSHDPPPQEPRTSARHGSPISRLLGRLTHVRPRALQALRALTLLLVGGAYILGLNQPSATVLARKRELPVYCVERAEKVLSISFDASWGADKTIGILDLLDEYGIKTTFFLVGGWVDKYPDMVKEIAARGHEIGNHSDTHPHMSQQTMQQIKDEIRIMSDKVETLTGVRPTLFRPPYGDYNDLVIATARAEGYEAVQWSIDSLDWKDRGTADIIKQCTYRVQNGDIVLFHNDSNDILNALPTVLKHYVGLGFTIVPVSELLLSGETTIDIQGRQHPSADPKQ